MRLLCSDLIEFGVTALEVSYYILVSLIIIIICYYYQLRPYRLDVYVNWLLKQKKFKMIHPKIMNVLNEYNKIMTEIDHLNKFALKEIFVLFLLNASTVMLIVYN